MLSKIYTYLTESLVVVFICSPSESRVRKNIPAAQTGPAVNAAVRSWHATRIAAAALRFPFSQQTATQRQHSDVSSELSGKFVQHCKLHRVR